MTEPMTRERLIERCITVDDPTPTERLVRLSDALAYAAAERKTAQNRFERASETAVARGVALDQISEGKIPEDVDDLCITNAGRYVAALQARVVAEQEAVLASILRSSRMSKDDEFEQWLERWRQERNTQIGSTVLEDLGPDTDDLQRAWDAATETQKAKDLVTVEAIRRIPNTLDAAVSIEWLCDEIARRINSTE